jgi:hypothetical protein
MARIAYEATQNGKTTREFAADVGRTQAHISHLTTVWTRYGGDKVPYQLRFTDAYELANHPEAEAEDLLRRFEAQDHSKSLTGFARTLRAERKVPTNPEDKVEMARKLLAEPEIAARVVRDVDTHAAISRAERAYSDEVVANSGPVERTVDYDGAHRALLIRTDIDRWHAIIESWVRDHQATPLPDGELPRLLDKIDYLEGGVRLMRDALNGQDVEKELQAMLEQGQ